MNECNTPVRSHTCPPDTPDKAARVSCDARLARLWLSSGWGAWLVSHVPEPTLDPQPQTLNPYTLTCPTDTRSQKPAVYASTSTDTCASQDSSRQRSATNESDERLATSA